MTLSSVDAPETITEEMAKAHVSAVLTQLKNVQLRPGGTGEITFKKMVTLSKAKVTEGSLHRWSSGGALILDKNLPDLKTVFDGVRAEYRRHHRGVAEGDLPRVLQPATFNELDKIVRGARKAERRQAAKRKAQRGKELAYPGFAAYDGSMSGWFYGRDDDVTRMITRLDNTYRCDRPTPIPLVARSGTGKSSYLAAGVAPAIRVRGLPSAQEVKDWAILTITPGSAPVTNLLRAIPALRAAAEAPEHDRDAVHAALAEHAAPGLVLFVDQAEEMFQSQVPAAERRRFGELLAALADVPTPGSPPVALVIVALRADFFHRLGDVPALHDARHHVEYLEHLTEVQLRAVITEPVLRLTGRRASEELVSRILADAQVAARGSDDGQLPLIAHVLHLMNKQKRFSLACYEELGGLDGAVRKTADNVWEKIRSTGIADTATELLLRLVHVGDGPEHDTRRRVLLTDLADGPRASEVQQALEILSAPDARLLAITEGQTGGGEAEVTIIHESLLRLWPQLADTVSDERSDLIAQQELERDARRWATKDRDPILLPRRHYLIDAQKLATKYGSGGVVRDFLDAATTEDGLDRRRRKRQRRLPWIAAIASTLLALTGAVAVVVDHQKNNTITFTEVKAVADGLRSSDASAAAQLYLYDYDLRPTPELATDLLTTETAALSSPLHARHAAVRKVVYTRDGSAAIIASADGTVQMWDVRDRAHMHPLSPPLPETGRDTRSIVVTPDGRTVFAGDVDGLVRAWNVTNRNHPVPLGPPRQGVTAPHSTNKIFSGVLSMAITPDGHSLLFGGADGELHRWDITDPRNPTPSAPPLPGPRAVTSLAITPDGRTLAVGRTDHTVTMIDLTDPARLRTWGAPTESSKNALYSVAFSPTAPVLATAGADKLIHLWNSTDPAHLTPLCPPLQGNTNAIYGIAFSSDGLRLASAGADTVVRMWNLADLPRPAPLPPLGGHTRGVASLAFSPDDQTLISGGVDATVRVWSLPQVLLGHRGSVTTQAMTPDGNTLVSGGQDGTLRTWNIAGSTAAPLSPPIPGDPRGVITLALTPDGDTAATAGVQGTLQLWDMTNKSHPVMIGSPQPSGGKPIYGASFSADAHVLATAGADNLIHIWTIGSDGATPETTFSPDGQTHAARSPTGVGAVQFFPAGRVLAVGAQDDTVHLWDLANPHHPRDLGRTQPHTAFIKAIAISPDGATLAAGSADHTITLTDVRDPAHPRSWGPAAAQHRNPVTSLVFTPDNQQLISGGDDGNVMRWDVHNPAHPTLIGAPLPISTSEVRQVALNPGRQLLAVAGRDQLITVMSTDVQQAIARICRATPHALSRKSWDKYVPERAFEPPCDR